MSARSLGIAVGVGLTIAIAFGRVRADSPSSTGNGLNLSDLAAYQSALNPSTSATRAEPTTFRDLWDHPDRYRGKRVRIEGKLARRFRQGKVGEFPPLAENWIFTGAGDPICVVYPSAKQETVKLGDSVRFEGTYLRTISYQGGDVSRLAPLIVGPSPLSTAMSSTRGDQNHARAWSVDWPIGVAAAAVVALVLGRRHLQKPVSLLREPPPWEPAPEFVEGLENHLDEPERYRTEEREPS